MREAASERTRQRAEAPAHAMPRPMGWREGDRPIAWHYAPGFRLALLMKSGAIQPCTGYRPDGERPAVWLTLDQGYEQTANRVHRNDDGTYCFGDVRSTHDDYGGLVRLGVAMESVPTTWIDYLHTGGIRASDWRRLDTAARRTGSDPSLWRLSYEAVQREAWVAVEQWDPASASWEAVRLGTGNDR